jgi:DedD protein
LAVVLLISVAIGTIALVFPQRLAPMLANSPTLKQTLPSWMMNLVAQMASKPATVPPEAKPEAKPEPKPEPTPAPAAETKTSVPAPAADSSANKSETGTAKPPPAADVVTSTDTAPAKPADKAKPAEPPASVANAAEASTTKAAAEDPLAPRSERGVDQMIRQAPPGSIFVQHVSVKTMAEAQEWRANYRALSGAKIAAVTSPNKGVRYILVSGPFANRKEAETFVRKDGIPSDPWLRPVRPLQRVLQPTNR